MLRVTLPFVLCTTFAYKLRTSEREKNGQITRTREKFKGTPAHLLRGLSSVSCVCVYIYFVVSRLDWRLITVKNLQIFRMHQRAEAIYMVKLEDVMFVLHADACTHPRTHTRAFFFFFFSGRIPHFIVSLCLSIFLAFKITKTAILNNI